MLDKGVQGSQIFFSDETKIEMGSYINDSYDCQKETKIN